MDIERLRALVQSWREIADKHDARAERLNESGDASDAAWCEAAAEHRSYCADELATLIAELGQEVGAVAQVLEIRKADEEDAWFGRVEFTEPLKVGALLSPAHTSEARDAARYRWLAENAIIQWPGVTHIGDDPASTRLPLDNAIDAAMRQEAGSRE